MSYSTIALSGSTNGRNILVVATASAGTAIHSAHATSLDFVTLKAHNTDTSRRKLTIEFGGTTSPNDLIEKYLEPESGEVLIVTHRPITNSVVVRAFCDAANVVSIGGHVDRVT